MRIALCQINPILGNFENNSNLILNNINRAKTQKCDLAIFPECALMGYHPYDLLERKALVIEQLKFLEKIQKNIPKDMAVIFGLITLNKSKRGRPYKNSAVFLQSGKKPVFFHKELLPQQDVFDEARFIQNGSLNDNFFEFKKHNFFVTICEDIWAWELPQKRNPHEKNPLLSLNKRKLDFVINLSASPFYKDKFKDRKVVCQKTAKHFKANMVYLNLVGAQDEIIYDGSSFVLAPSGKILAQCASFNEDFLVFDSKQKSAVIHPRFGKVEELRQALILGIRDFCSKVGIRKVHLGLSGGIDSALVACLAVDALGPNNVLAVALSTQFNLNESFKAAQELCSNLKIKLQNISIQETFEQISDLLRSSLGVTEFGLVHENLQARIRGLLLMAISNMENSLLLATSNKSEFATGYSTLYGDMCGGLAPIGDLTKQEVYALANLYNSQMEIIPNFIIERAPSAELRPNQKDQDTLPEYFVLDKVVEKIVSESGVASSHTEKWLIKSLYKSEFKRWQAPPVLKVTARSFGRGRRYPIAHQSDF